MRTVNATAFTIMVLAVAMTAVDYWYVTIPLVLIAGGVWLVRRLPSVE